MTIPLALFGQYSSPESAVYDVVGQRWIISNAGSGRIVERSIGGEVRAFATNLTSPKGLCIVNDTLYTADETRIRAFRLTTRAAIFTVNVANSSFLNDVASDSSFLYFSEMTRNKIYRMNLGTREVAPYVEQGLTNPNGLFFDKENNRLIVVSYHEDSPIQQVDLHDGSLSTIVNTELADLDGITRDGNGNYYISSWGSNAIHRFNNDFSEQTVLEEGFDGPADIYYSQFDNILAIPCMSSHRVVFRATPPPEAELRTPMFLDFGDVSVHTGLEHAIALRNTGGDTLFVDSVSHSGVGFEVGFPENLEIVSGESQDVQITFLPVDSVVYIDTMRIFSNEPMTPRTIVLIGRGVAAPWLRTEDVHDFGRKWVDFQYNYQFQIVNSGLSTLTLDSVVSVSRVFGISLPARRAVAPGGGETATLIFSPRLRREYQDTLWIYSNDPGSPAHLIANGVGVNPPLLRLPAGHDFGVVDTGQSEHWTMDWVNVGDDTLILDSVTVGGNDQVFTVQMPEQTWLAPGDTVHSNVMFRPIRPVLYTEHSDIYSNDPSGPIRITLQGTGRDPNDAPKEVIPRVFSISEGFPAPFNSSVSFAMELPVESDVRLFIYDIDGRRIREVLDTSLSAGTHKVIVDGAGLSGGVYFLRGSAGTNKIERKIVYLK